MNMPWTWNACCPVPRHVEHVAFFSPGFNPLPLHGLQSTTGVIVTFLLVPAHASVNDNVTVVSRSSPRT